VWIKIYIPLFISFLFSFQVIGQIEDKLITIKVVAYPLSEVLFELSDQAHFDFSYDSKGIASDLQLSIEAKDQPLGVVLNVLCTQAGLTYKINGEQINFFPLNEHRTVRSGWTLSGMITDQNSNFLLDSVIIEDKYLGIKSMTNSYGEYALSIPNPDYRMDLRIHKPGYVEKEMEIRVQSDLTLNIQMEQTPKVFVEVVKPIDETDIVESVAPDTSTLFILRPPERSFKDKLLEPVHEGFWATKLLSKRIIDHLRDTVNFEETSIRLTLVPGVSTTGSKSSTTMVNGLSLNVLVGYSSGLKGVELSSMINIDRFNVTGLQAAGFGNLNGGKTTGVQLAGFSNVGKMKVDGIQAAGFSNIAGFNLIGVQLSGFNNIVRGSVHGLQAAGFNNVVTGGGAGLQASGFVNTVHGHWTGAQASGFLNVGSGRVSGLQLSGFLNVAKEIKGAQLSGFLNYAKVVRGLQLGIINISDSIESGVAIGMFTFSKKGFRRYELVYQETQYIQFHFKSGSKTFYNIFAAGYNPFTLDPAWNIGYGIGTRLLDRRMFADLEAIVYAFNAGNSVFEEDFLGKLYVNFGYSIAKRFAIVAGPTLNFQVNNGPSTLELQINNWTSQSFSSSSYFSNAWVGLNVGLQF